MYPQVAPSADGSQGGIRDGQAPKAAGSKQGSGIVTDSDFDSVVGRASGAAVKGGPANAGTIPFGVTCGKNDGLILRIKTKVVSEWHKTAKSMFG